MIDDGYTIGGLSRLIKPLFVRSINGIVKYADHQPVFRYSDLHVVARSSAAAHFHARYGSGKIGVEIDSGATTGIMSKRAVKMVQEWRELHKEDLPRE